jgi:hypothetical protein
MTSPSRNITCIERTWSSCLGSPKFLKTGFPVTSHLDDHHGAVQGDRAHAKKTRAKRGSPKNVLRLPDLDHSKTSVLQSLGSIASKRTYAANGTDGLSIPSWRTKQDRFSLPSSKPAAGPLSGLATYHLSHRREGMQRSVTRGIAQISLGKGFQSTASCSRLILPCPCRS